MISKISLFKEHYRVAYASIRSRRTRSILTLFGIIVGVASVVTVVSLGEGVKQQISNDTHRQGKDVLVLRPGRTSSSLVGSLTFAPSGSRVLTDNELTAVENVEGITRTVPFSVISAVPSYDGRIYDQAQIIGTTGDMPKMSNVKVEIGAFFDNDTTTQKVAVIGQSVAEKLFGENVPVGKIMKIRDQDFVVRAVLEKADVGPFSEDNNFNNAILIPYQVGKVLTGGNGQYYQIIAQVDNPKDIDKVASAINVAVKNEHGGMSDFSVIKPGDSIVIANNMTYLVARLIFAVATIALLLGGINIMNIILVSVTERTQEIGIRKAVGATSRQIFNQFLMEATLLSLWDASIGMVISIIINLVLRITTNLQPVVTWEPIAISVAVSILIGIIFGTVPAVKAARKDPIEALRSSQ